MDNFSRNIVDTFKIFYLLTDDIRNSINLLESNNNHSIKRLAFKSLYIDLCSFIDELNLFRATLHKEEFDDLKDVNRFLLISHRACKVLTKRDKTISVLRNTIFAHNYRNKQNDFADPYISFLVHYEEAPFLGEELQYLGEVALLIASLAFRCFHFNTDLAFARLKKSFEDFEHVYPYIESIKNKSPELSIENLRNDVYQIEDTLRSNGDNYSIISKKLNCRIRNINSR